MMISSIESGGMMGNGVEYAYCCFSYLVYISIITCFVIL